MPDGRTRAKHNLDNRRSFSKDAHPGALQINIYNSCDGNFQDVVENNLPKKLADTYRYNTKLGLTPQARGMMKYHNQTQYIGWYARKILKDKNE